MTNEAIPGTNRKPATNSDSGPLESPMTAPLSDTVEVVGSPSAPSAHAARTVIKMLGRTYLSQNSWRDTLPRGTYQSQNFTVSS